MLVSRHIIFGFVFSLLLYLIFSITFLGALIIFLSSFLIDVDHYLYYVYKKKDWSLKNAYGWYFKNDHLFKKMTKEEKENIYTGLCFLHGIETIIFLLILSFFFPLFSSLFLFIIIGFLFHQTLDSIELYEKDYKFDKVISFVYSWVNSRNKRLLQEI